VTLLGGLVATALDTAAYLAVTGLIAWVVDAVVATSVITLMM
jgi:acyl-coenzyme A thioesterase PaaI-like protein